MASITSSANTAIFYALESGNDEALGTELDPSAGTYPSLYKPFPLTDAERTQLTRYIQQIIPLPSAFVIGNVGLGTTTQRIHVVVYTRRGSDPKFDTNGIRYDNSVYGGGDNTELTNEEAMAAVKRQLDTFMANNQLTRVSSDDLFCEIQRTRGILGIAHVAMQSYTVETTTFEVEDDEGNKTTVVKGTMKPITSLVESGHKILMDKNNYWSYSLGGTIFGTPGVDSTKTIYGLDFFGE